MAIVPASDNIYTGDGTTTQFAIGFHYLKENDVAVSIDEVLTAFTFTTPGIVNITPAPASGAIVRVFRNTDATEVPYVFSDGVPFLTRYADFNWQTLLYVFQEAWAEFKNNSSNFLKTLRTADNLNPITGDRANKLLGFDADGQPTTLLYTPESIPLVDARLTVVESFIAGIYNIFPKTVATVAALNAYAPVVGQLVYITEYNLGTGYGGGFVKAKSGVIVPNNVTTFASGTSGLYYERINVDAITLELAGGGPGINNQTAWERVYNNFNSCTLLARDYLVDNLNIRKAFTIKTQGFTSRLLQNAGVTGTNQQISVITVAASDVKIEDIALRGNISTDTGEDRHGIRVDASTVPGGISKIHIGNISVSNPRGDCIVFTGSAGRDVSDFSVGNIFGFNVFRNGCSVVSGKNGKIGVVSVAGEGLFAFDSEPDSSGGIVENITVAGVHGRHCGIPAVTSVQKGITFGFVDLDWNLPQSTPAFSPIQESEVNGIVYRSTNGCHIEYCRLRNFPESPIRVFKEVSDAYVDNISFGTLIIENCLTALSNPPCLIRASGAKNIVVRGTLKYTCTNTALHELILDGSTTGLVRLSANRIEGNAPIGRYISVDCQSSEIAYGNDRSCLTFIGNCVLNNAVWDVGIISASSFGLLTFNSSSLKWTGSFKYADGITTNFHTYELNSLASATAGATPTWAATRVDS